jgi:hypothetical protein
LGIEHREIDCGFDVLDRRIILGVEMMGILHCHDRGLAATLYARMVQIDPPVPRQLAKLLKRFRPRKKHRVTEMEAALPIGEYLIEEQPLIDFMTVFLGLNVGRLPCHAVGRRAKARHLFGDRKGQIFDAPESMKIIGQITVDSFRMDRKKGDARLSRLLKDDLNFRLLRSGPISPRRHLIELR